MVQWCDSTEAAGRLRPRAPPGKVLLARNMRAPGNFTAPGSENIILPILAGEGVVPARGKRDF